MRVRRCDLCGTEIPADVDFELAGPVQADFCSPQHLTGYVDEHFIGKRPDFPAGHRVLAEHGQVTQLPVPASAGQRVTAAELEEVARVAALDDAVDAGILDDEQPEFEGEPVVMVHRGRPSPISSEVEQRRIEAAVRNLPRGRRSHTMLAADVALRMQGRLEADK